MTQFLHSMLRVSDPQATIDFFKLLGLEERRRTDVPQGKFTLIFLGAGDDVAEVELTHNWDEAGYDGGRNFGHLAFRVDDIYATCAHACRGRGDDQPPAARRPYGVRPLARRHFGRTAAEGRARSPRPSRGRRCPTRATW